VAPRHARRAAEGRAGAYGPLDGRDDDALRPPLARRAPRRGPALGRSWHMDGTWAAREAKLGRNLGKTGWRRRESNPGPRGFRSVLVHVRSRIARAAGFPDSAGT